MSGPHGGRISRIEKFSDPFGGEIPHLLVVTIKPSISITVLILALCLGLGWRERQRLALLRENHELPAAEAAQLGISASPENPKGHWRSVRDDQSNAAKRFASELIAYAKEITPASDGHGNPEQIQERLMEFLARKERLNAKQMNSLIAGLWAAADLEDGMRVILLRACMSLMASDHPQATLALFTGSSDLSKDLRRLLKDQASGQEQVRSLVKKSLTSWALDNPVAAWDWILKNNEKHPDLRIEDAMCSVVGVAATHDPALGWRFVDEMPYDDSGENLSWSRAGDTAMAAAKTPSARIAALASFRQYLLGPENAVKRERIYHPAMSGLASQVIGDGFESASSWISQAGLSEEEMSCFTTVVGSGVLLEETGQWIEDLGANVPPDQSKNTIGRIMETWTAQDPQAAAAWLNSAADGPAKHAAIRSFAETVAHVDLETAARWTLTLPAGQDREKTLNRVREEWSKVDPGGAAAFVKGHEF